MTARPDAPSIRPRRWVLIAAAIIMPACAVAIVASGFSLFAARHQLDESHAGLAYACGYRAGQENIMKSTIANYVPKVEPDYCIKYRAAAGEQGFHKEHQYP